MNIHRNGDARACGASTIATNQSSVYINGQLVAVENDQNSHGGGGLISISNKGVYAETKKIIIVGDTAQTPDISNHNNTQPVSGSANVFL
jgi:uncharacterized Zn-binding protein involved in type VI secretion